MIQSLIKTTKFDLADQMKQNSLPSLPRMHINNFVIRRLFQDQWLYVGNFNIHLQIAIIFSLSIKLPVIFGQVDKMEENAQGRVWTGKDAASRGLVDAIGGLSRAVAIAKQKADIPQDRPVGSYIYPCYNTHIFL